MYPLGTTPQLDSLGIYHPLGDTFLGQQPSKGMTSPLLPSVSLSPLRAQKNPRKLLVILRYYGWNLKEALRATISRRTERFWSITEALTSPLHFLPRLWLLLL